LTFSQALIDTHGIQGLSEQSKENDMKAIIIAPASFLRIPAACLAAIFSRLLPARQSANLLEIKAHENFYRRPPEGSAPGVQMVEIWREQI